MAQGLFTLGVSVANRPSAELQNALLCQIPFKRFRGKFCKILGGHFCSKKRSGSEYGSFCRFWERQFPVDSGGFQRNGLFNQNLAFYAQFQVEFSLRLARLFGGKLEIMVGKRKFAFCTALCC